MNIKMQIPQSDIKGLKCCLGGTIADNHKKYAKCSTEIRNVSKLLCHVIYIS